jgi:predicted ATP-grasp superfamily ATP-dependent carboligase
LSEVLGGKGFAHPRVLPRGEPCPTLGRWLVKAERSSGGIGVRAATPGERPAAREYLQEFVVGPAMSAVFRAEPPRVELVGITEQLVGASWLYARGFKYAGNIGPAAVSANVESQLSLLGWRLVTVLALRGVFGVDFILHNDAPWVVEVNPRYPASVEVLEHATGRAVFGGNRPIETTRSVGKAIYYAPHPLAFPKAGPWDADLAGEFDPWRSPDFADIPHPGTVIERDWPVLTILVSGSSPDEVRERLQSRAAGLDRILADASP